jgi:hypothetical protein
VLVEGADFYSDPIVSPDWKFLAWIQWNHPNMPWDGTELWVGKLSEDGSLTERVRIAGGADESIYQPVWSPDGLLHFVSDRTGWWNLYRWRDSQVEALCPLEAEFGQPQWAFGGSLYGFASEKQIVCSYSKNGNDFLATLDIATKTLRDIEVPFSAISQVRVAADRVLFIGASATDTSAIVDLNLKTKAFEVLRRARETNVDAGYFPKRAGIPGERGLTAHSYFYAPKNRDFVAPANSRRCWSQPRRWPHRAQARWDIRFNIDEPRHRVLDMNCNGSSGYGRAYRERLNGQWGIVDVDDCANGALSRGTRRSRWQPPGDPRRQRQRLPRSARLLSVIRSKPAPATTASATSKR